MERRPVKEVKEATPNGEKTTQTTEPEVYKQVAADIKAIGDNVRKQIDELKTSHEAMKKTLDEHPGHMDVLVSNKLSKLQEDILTRQEALEKGFTDRMDNVEALAKRMASDTKPRTSKEESEAIMEAKTFLLHREIVNGRRPQEIADDKVDMKMFDEYRKAFHLYLVTPKDSFSALYPEAAKYLTVGSDPDGGVLVTPAMSNRIVQRIWEMGPYRSLCAIETIGTDALEIMEDLEEAGDAWETETAATSTTGTPRWNRKRITVHWQSARPKATQQMLDDASINVEAWLSNKVSQKLARTEADAFPNGDGVKQPRGFLTYPAYTGTASDGGVTFGQIEQTASGAAASLTTDGLINHKFSLLEDFLASATYIMNRLTVRDAMLLKDGDGQYIWRPGITEGSPSMLLGLPIRMAKEMPLVSAGTLPIALADWRQAYTIVDRQGITVQRDPYTIKPFVEFYVRRRVGGDVVNFQAIKLLVVSA